MLADRSSGILLHPTSLPSRGGIGDLGPAAYDFLDFLSRARQSVWQILPLSPTGYGNSPYSSLSAFAGNTLLISLERLAERGWLAPDQVAQLPAASGPVDYDAAFAAKVPLLRQAAATFLQRAAGRPRERFDAFVRDNSSWLEDYVLFAVLRDRHNRAPWNRWPSDIARRHGEALARVRDELRAELAIERVIQFFFAEQWSAIRAACRRRGIRILGDVAIFVSFDSADVWTHRDIFRIDDRLELEVVAGVPPDAFSATGQYWGNPLYRWDVLAARGYWWWIERIRRALAQCDFIRLDHFRGFESCWEIPGGDTTAVRGRWVDGPRDALFHALGAALGDLPFIAEDLGMITDEVHALRARLGMPGMRVLQFAFGNRGAHIYLPHRYEHNTVVYTGTHDNDTTEGWWRNSASADEKTAVREYIGNVDAVRREPRASDAPPGMPGLAASAPSTTRPEFARAEGVAWALMRAAASSIANLCIFPAQDVLSLGSEARMNVPNNPANNWRWRLAPGALTPDLAHRLAALTDVTDRAPTATLTDAPADTDFAA
jgi:4-alpha-glucanotransferase